MTMALGVSLPPLATIMSKIVARRRARAHALRRINERGLPFTAGDLDWIERRMKQLKPAWLRPDHTRCRISVARKHGRRRQTYTLIYDTDIGAIVTLWRRGGK